MEEVGTLLSHGTNPNLGLYTHPYTPLASVAEYGASVEIVDMLLRVGTIVQGIAALHVAALKGRMDLLHQLLESNADMNEIGFEYAAVEQFAKMAGGALHIVVDDRSEKIVKLSGAPIGG